MADLLVVGLGACAAVDTAFHRVYGGGGLLKHHHTAYVASLITVLLATSAATADSTSGIKQELRYF